MDAWLTLALSAAVWSSSGETNKGVEAMDADFRTVPRAFRVMQYVMGRDVDGETAERYGLGGLVCAVRGDRFYKGEYLRDEAEWARLTNQVDATLDRGLKVWLFDERGYPSGGAGDLVVKQYPQYENIGVYHQTVAGRDKRPARIELPADARRFVGATVYPRDESGVRHDRGVPAVISGNTVSTQGLDGEWVLYAFIERFIREGTHAHIVGPTFGWERGLYPNLLDRDAVAKFIEITYDAYARRLGPDRLRRVEAFYSNEPSLKALYFAAGSRAHGEAYVPWVASLPARFRKMHGYDLPPRMGALFTGEANACRRVRMHFYQTVGAIMAESYAGQLSRWCRKHGTMLTGHLLSEELICYHPSLYGDFFKQTQGFDLPGVDVPLIKPETPVAGHFLGARFVSSAAHAVGKHHVQALMDPILGKWADERGRLPPIPLEALLRCVNLLFYNGINHVTIFGAWDRSPAADYERFNLYTGRLAALLRDAVNTARVAVYYPLESFQARYRPTPHTIWSEQKEYWDLQASVLKLERWCHDHSVDHNFIDAEAVKSADITGGALTVGANRYNVLLMPAVEIISLDVLRRIDRFEAAGGVVIWTDTRPRLGAREREDAAVAALMAGANVVQDRVEVLRAVRKAAPPRIVFNAPDAARPTVWAASFTRLGKALYLLINDGAASVELKNIRTEDAGGLRVYDPFTGAMASIKQGDPLRMEPYCACVLAAVE